MSKHHSKIRHYQNLRERYTNCTYVEGNLEITWIDDDHLDLSFLSQIREVTGYVLISYVDVKRLVLPSLQIIRGRSLFSVPNDERDFSLMVAKCSKMETLEMPALRDILHGSVGLFDNYNLCHIKTINWTEIISDKQASYTYQYNITETERECPPCDKSCVAGCWGEGAHNCQQFSKINCSPQCADGRCFGPNPRECCHSLVVWLVAGERVLITANSFPRSTVLLSVPTEGALDRTLASVVIRHAQEVAPALLLLSAWLVVTSSTTENAVRSVRR
ncbi:unnamed protein product [Cyprideis torosa]|uniref:Receptor L-domain domain-containing protein n=1 Tax=Cyprideis torosa TaxID=163714 RepID=A0A7R8W628_9CRUS|nr:unnamed protein product [Cyprideis torosa]CAG0882101.1 unnamed protein product [Cyprideis torosa]